jgi:hypothetical protein
VANAPELFLGGSYVLGTGLVAMFMLVGAAGLVCATVFGKSERFQLAGVAFSGMAGVLFMIGTGLFGACSLLPSRLPGRPCQF